MASLLVWSQDGRTFTLREGALIDSGEQPYTFGSKPIRLAHPMEMKPGDVSAWQRYFSGHAIKQPFAQVWEPFMRPETVRVDRYQGCEVPVYRFKGQEKHGIDFEYDQWSSDQDLSIYFSDHALEFNAGAVLGRYEIYLDKPLTLGKFTSKTYTRLTNHIVARLDQWTIIGRIMRDDVTIMAQMKGTTLAQVMQYLNLAIDNGKTNITAELLNYKNEHFPGFDPMAEFTLDDL